MLCNDCSMSGAGIQEKKVEKLAKSLREKKYVDILCKDSYLK